MQLMRFPSRREFSVLKLPSVWMVENFVLLLNFVLSKFKIWSYYNNCNWLAVKVYEEEQSKENHTETGQGSLKPNCWATLIFEFLVFKCSPVIQDPGAGEDWRQEEKGMTEGEVVGWPHWLNGHGSGWITGVGDGRGGLACCGLFGC